MNTVDSMRVLVRRCFFVFFEIACEIPRAHAVTFLVFGFDNRSIHFF